MKLTDNTILITGGGSGIGRGLAESFHALGNKIIIAGRREKVLQDIVKVNPGMKYLTFDQSSSESVNDLAAQLIKDFPDLNALINNSGIQHLEDLTQGDSKNAELTITTNLVGPIRLTAQLLPSLIKKPRATILNVSSGLAFVPSAMIPTYCATKAALHSYTQSLRFQLRKTSVQVIEIIPPWVQTELQGERGMHPKAMPLKDYIAETMDVLTNSPEANEILIERVKAMRFAERDGYEAFFNNFNEGWVALQSKN